MGFLNTDEYREMWDEAGENYLALDDWLGLGDMDTYRDFVNGYCPGYLGIEYGQSL